MPVAETCPVCSSNSKPVWLKQKDVEVQRCQMCNEIWPFGKSSERPVAVQLEMLASDLAHNAYAFGASSVLSDPRIYDGWDAHHFESVGMDSAVHVSEDTRWHAGWLAREIMYGDIEYVGVAPADAQITEAVASADLALNGPQSVMVQPDKTLESWAKELEVDDRPLLNSLLTTGVPSSLDPEVSALVREDDRRQIDMRAGQREMDRLWAEMEAKSKEPWNPPDLFSGTSNGTEVTGLQGIPGDTDEDDRQREYHREMTKHLLITEDERTP